MRGPPPTINSGDISPNLSLMIINQTVSRTLDPSGPKKIVLQKKKADIVDCRFKRCMDYDNIIVSIIQ